MENGESKVLNRIRDLQERLSSTERVVAQFVLERPREVVFSSITELADSLNVGETTVLRFCRKVGFKGYQEFKLSLASSLGEGAVATTAVLEGVAPDPLAALAEENIRAIRETAAVCRAEALTAAAEALVNARRIHFYGVGSSGVTALDAKYKFLRIGLMADSFPDTHLQAMAASSLDRQDAAVGLSVSGSTKDTVESLKLARQAGARTISITSYARSPITRYSDVVLLMATRESPLQGGGYSAKIAQLHVLDLLATTVAEKLGRKALLYRERTAKAVLDKLY
ncbi:MAG: MurR/RpiR family transcriptional regulator [Betaproteobacteria bacterium]